MASIKRSSDGTATSSASDSGQSQETTQERPKGRIDHPVGKQQYLDKVEEETVQEDANILMYYDISLGRV